MKKLFNKNTKYKVLTALLLVVVTIACVTVKSNVKATSYVYDFWKNVIPSSEGITYKETYYNSDIAYYRDYDELSDEEKEKYPEYLPTFSNLTDMEVYEDTIYVLDYASTTFELGTGKVEKYSLGSVYIINQDFKYTHILKEFLISDEVKAKLDEFYHFSTPLDKITPAQVTSTEFVDIYDGILEEGVVSEGVVKFSTFEYKEGNNLVLTDISDPNNPVVIDESEYTVKKVSIQEEEITTDKDGNQVTNKVNKTYSVVTFDNYQEGAKIKASYTWLDKPGRAPYVPSSTDETKAAVILDSPQGITVTDKYILIADTENLRILKIDKFTLEVVDVYLTPEDSSFYQLYDSEYETEYGVAYETIKEVNDYYTNINNHKIFKPTKVALNSSGVCYCIAQNAYEGLIEFGDNTEFNRYVGKNTVVADALKQLWSNIWSEEQYASQALDLPAMFNNITVSPDGFLYATSNPDSEATKVVNLVKVINTKGNDIMKRNGYVTPDGDAVYLTTSKEDGVVLGSSVLTAVCVSKTGNFTVTDEKRGRLFTYDSEGNLLYITGDQPGGTQQTASGGLSNSIISPIAVDYLYRTNVNNEEEETVIVLDKSSKSILLYETTEFGKAVNTATYLYQTGQIEDQITKDEKGNDVVVKGAESYWREVIRMNTNYELAYLGIGKALNRRGEYKEAMKYFELAHNATYYSKAFNSYRDAVLNENFNLLMAVVMVAIAGYAIAKITTYVNKKNKENAKNEEGGNK